MTLHHMRRKRLTRVSWLSFRSIWRSHTNFLPVRYLISLLKFWFETTCDKIKAELNHQKISQSQYCWDHRLYGFKIEAHNALMWPTTPEHDGNKSDQLWNHLLGEVVKSYTYFCGFSVICPGNYRWNKKPWPESSDWDSRDSQTELRGTSEEVKREELRDK